MALGSALITLVIVTPKYQIDDAFIGFRYARNLWDGHNLVFNPGEYVEGYTSFLWVVMSALAYPLGIPAIHWVQGISVVAQIITVWFAFKIGIRCGRTPMQSLIAPLFLATNLSFVTYPMTGMDTSFICMLVTLAVYVLQGGLEDRRNAIKMGILLVLIALTRFDGFVMCGILGFWFVIFDRKIKAAMPTLLIFGGAMVIYHAWRLMTYPSLLPNTFHAKMGGVTFDRFILGVTYVMRFIIEGWQFLLIMGVIPFVLGRPARAVLILGWVSLMQLAYAAHVSDWMPYYRFMLPVIPLLMVLMQEGVWTVHDVAKPVFAERRFARVVGALALVMLFSFSLMNFYRAMFNGYKPSRPLRAQFINQMGGREFNPWDSVLIGEAIDKQMPQDWLVAAEWAGVMPAYFHQRILDIFCLNDADAVKNDFRTSTVGMAMTPEYLKSRDPHVVVVVGALHDTADEARKIAHHRIHEGETNTLGGQWIRGLYGVLENEEYGYKMETMKVGDRHWAFLLRGDLEWPPPSSPPSGEQSK